MRAEMVRRKRDKIGAKPQKYVEVDETSAGVRTRGEGQGMGR